MPALEEDVKHLRSQIEFHRRMAVGTVAVPKVTVQIEALERVLDQAERGAAAARPISEYLTSGPYGRLVCLLCPSGYSSTPHRYVVGRHVEGAWRDYAGERVEDEGPPPTHFFELLPVPEPTYRRWEARCEQHGFTSTVEGGGQPSPTQCPRCHQGARCVYRPAHAEEA